MPLVHWVTRLLPSMRSAGSWRGFASKAKVDVNIDKIAYGFMGSQALFTGLELGIFEHIAAAGGGGARIEVLKTAVGITSPRLQTLLTALTSLELLRRSGEGHYTLSRSASSFLLSSSPHFYGDYLRLQVGRQFYPRLADLAHVLRTGDGLTYAGWLGDSPAARQYTRAQHNGSLATARAMAKRTIRLEGVRNMLDVGGGSGAFSYAFAEVSPDLHSTVLELPEVCVAGEEIRAEQLENIAERVRFVPLDVTSPTWPVQEGSFDLVLMSYLSGSVPAASLVDLYVRAKDALRPGGLLAIHDFMVDDGLDGPVLGALWALQHVTVNTEGLGLCPSEISKKLVQAGFCAEACETVEMIRGMTKLVTARREEIVDTSRSRV